ncbi:MAG: SDR family oxidoreductase [Chloroflexaceae bacterium]|nr:SDR family oxidoreductase [Chloroflexaceae bacterium]
MTRTRWTANDIPDQTGRTHLVTGANSGLGYETSLALARKGATVIMACRNMEKGHAAAAEITQQVPNAKLDLQQLDLASLASIRSFAERINANYRQLEVLFNNAGIMGPVRQETADGFEMQIGTNHLGHFALTGLLLDLLLATPRSRIVSTSSIVHGMGRIYFEDLHGKQRYERWQWYGQSKLANLLFGLELQRRLTTLTTTTISVIAHPGYSATHLQTTGPSTGGAFSLAGLLRFTNRYVAQSGAMGALPQLYAGTAPGVLGGEFYGPDGFGMRGYPEPRLPNRRAFNTADAARLWQISEELTGVPYTAFQPAAV